MADRKGATLAIEIRNVSDIINKVDDMNLDAVENAIKEEFPKLVLKAVRIHDYYLRSEIDSKKQKIADQILKLSVDEKFWATLKSMTFGNDRKRDNKAEWGKEEATEVEAQ